jgi:hypothetical protein
MTTNDQFSDTPVIGKMRVEDAAAKLRELEDDESANHLLRASAANQEVFGIRDWLGWETPGWAHTAHAFGYIAPVGVITRPQSIEPAANVAADQSLKNAKVNVTLRGLRAARYPGRGAHRVLFDFYARNSTASGSEDVHFNSTFKVQEGERAAVVGYPIFLGLNTGSEGLGFKCFTVNVKNDQDESLLAVLESDVFRAGLRLTESLQPAIAPLSGLAVGLIKSFAKRNRNVGVQEFYLGLDFSDLAGGARLAEGMYLAVQIPEKSRRIWDWSEWVYLPSGDVVHRDDSGALIPYNFVAFGISRYTG